VAVLICVGRLGVCWEAAVAVKVREAVMAWVGVSVDGRNAAAVMAITVGRYSVGYGVGKLAVGVF
jgi:hypothetical protein